MIFFVANYKGVGFFFSSSKDFMTFQSLKGNRAHNVVYVVCNSHLVILPKYLIRAHNMLPLSVSRCMELSVSKERCFFSSPARKLSVSTRRRTTQAPCFFPQPPTLLTQRQKSLWAAFAEHCAHSLQTHRSLLSHHFTLCHRQALSSSRSARMLHL